MAPLCETSVAAGSAPVGGGMHAWCCAGGEGRTKGERDARQARTRGEAEGGRGRDERQEGRRRKREGGNSNSAMKNVQSHYLLTNLLSIVPQTSVVATSYQWYPAQLGSDKISCRRSSDHRFFGWPGCRRVPHSTSASGFHNNARAVQLLLDSRTLRAHFHFRCR